MDRVRTNAEVDVIVSDGRSFDSVLHASSHDADLVLMGLAQPMDAEHYAAYFERVFARVAGMPTTVLVLASEELKFSEVLLQQDLLTD